MASVLVVICQHYSIIIKVDCVYKRVYEPLPERHIVDVAVLEPANPEYYLFLRQHGLLHFFLRNGDFKLLPCRFQLVHSLLHGGMEHAVLNSVYNVLYAFPRVLQLVFERRQYCVLALLQFHHRIRHALDHIIDKSGFHGIIHHKALNPTLLYGFLVTGFAALGVYTFVVIVDYARSARSAFTHHERAAFAAIEFGCQQIIDLGFLPRGRFLILFKPFLHPIEKLHGNDSGNAAGDNRIPIDVNTAYFEENGGYDFARDFFEEAYRMAVKEAGDERYVLSAVLHADERNRGLSKALGYDVFHYHLHVVYIPVVEKEILWSKRCKDEALRGMVREIIHQVSRSKKWAYPEAVDEQGKPILGKNGKPIRIPSYSLLQDRFYEHMRLAGFDGFERGELGSTRVNLNSLDFKIQEDKKRLMQLEKLVAAKEMKLEQVSEKLVAQKQVNKQYHDLDGVGKKTVFGKIELTEKDYTDVISLAREGILSRVKISELTQKLQDAGARILDLQSSWERLYEQTKDFRQAVKLAPQRVKEVFTEIFAKDRETRELQRILRRSAKKRNEYER